MPKVTEQYRDDRRQQILDAARSCFLRNGFHATSMQDLFAESGLSAGAVYRYFPSKADMVLAIAEDNLRTVVAMVSDTTDAAEGCSVGEVLARIYELIQQRHARNGIAGLAVVVWSESLRDPALGTRFAALLEEMRASFAAAVVDQQRSGRITEAVAADAIAAVVVATVPGYMLQLALGGPDAVALFAPTARAMWP